MHPEEDDRPACALLEIQHNSIFNNGGLGIDLIGPDEDSRTTDVPTTNDGGTADDSDTGPNGLQNKPILSSPTTASGTTTIEGRPRHQTLF